MTTGGSTLCCAWCGKYLGNATRVTYLNGNQPVCDLCLNKAQPSSNKLTYTDYSTFPLPYEIEWMDWRGK